ncbi:hypothetical protein [Serratia fonticola]|uniref:hypothetical protein n=1 Tax=Serratia fonticola TaxID=47917 RepID=UPI000AC39AD9|nr:hypothetical protein [Serratia fonticola]
MKLLRNKISNSPMLSSILENAKPYSLINIFFYLVIFALFVISISFIFIFIFLNHAVDGKYTQFLILLTVAVTLLTLIYNIRRHVSEDYCKEAREYLKKAFEVIKPKDGEDRPRNDRFLWLTCARFLKTSERFGEKIIMASHKDMYLEERQYWRVKFHEVIKDFPSEYYAEKPEHLIMHNSSVRSPLAETSLYVIYNFTDWHEDYVDPLEDYRFSEEDIDKMQVRGPRGLGSLLAAHRNLKRKK